MQIDEFAAIVCKKVLAADAEGKYGESIRLLTQLRVALREQIAERAERLKEEESSA